jgi:1-acyl-sn-glycerol-3-phosphate acyltransferase
VNPTNSDALAPAKRERAYASFVLSAARSAAAALSTLFHLYGYRLSAALCREDHARLACSTRWTHRWFHSCARILGLRIRTSGPMPPPGALIAPNHLGYVDIVALGAVLECFFAAKADVERWPVFGHIFRVSRHVAVPRARAKGLQEAAAEIAARLAAGHRVCVFLEGTSTGGDRVLPFHGSLTQPAIDAQAPIVPAAIVWSAVRSDIDIAEDVAYWKDHVFARHLWRLFGLTGLRVDIRFGGPVSTAGRERKELAEAIRERVVALKEGRAGDVA